ncbi:RNA polymerase factor sigma-54 [Phaeovulum vinaykumarii]|uniref:RNA polymerase sigma-54 factor n=1 Tax=Phaeovulum vinaykumarii TaxID=407234 RepID=A0A1N7LKB2_9RHOB|nr:RNA polymerase factor sigma-54 [Phaeovulum vinaykumarii]SIS74278.1 RNA polymerase, sigma 54 subunit, RpoN/SigL [Phaeovulum vinaykumarii]SOC04958.1 RNA polymerase RpoN-/SigL-like sigma 54 subunit [Phaeovulum vinaykumarii]
MDMIHAQRQVTQLAMTADMQTALKVLQMTNADLSAFLVEEAQTNPCLEVAPPAPAAAGRAAPAPAARRAELERGAARAPSDFDPVAVLPEGKPSLHDHLSRQILLEFDPGPERELALALAGALEPSGWLLTDPEIVALGVDLPPEMAPEVLRRCQGLEPTGVFARNLSECLKLQAEEKGILDWGFGVILDNLDLLAEGRLEALARLSDGTVADVRAALAQIRRLNPKPGAAFQHDPAPILPPDLKIRREGGEWVVEMNRASLPALRIDAPPVAAGAAGRSEARAYLRKALSRARWLEQTIARREATLLRTAACLIAHQGAFLEQGARAIRPLGMEEVAQELELHPSTISRATADRLIETPRGTLPLRAFFSRAVTPQVMPGVAVPVDEAVETQAQDALMALVAEIVAKEDPARPLSDAAIVERAKAAGARLARRTVTKYREALNIPSSYDRKRQALLRTA